jgi:hypothetical protein
VRAFETAFADGKYGQAAMAAEQIYTVLNFIEMKQEAELIMERIGWGRIEKVFSEARVNVERGSDKKKAV